MAEIISERTLYNKVMDLHTVDVLPSGKIQIFVGKHPGHEVTSPQAFEMVEEAGLTVRNPEYTYFVTDHVRPTDDVSRPYKNTKAEDMTRVLEKNTDKHGITYFDQGSGKHGVCHVIYPELGLIWPGTITACGDSHTCTYGALGSIGLGIGTTQVSHVLGTQTLAVDPLKVRKIEFNGFLKEGVTAKDLVLEMIKQLGSEGGAGYVYELAGHTIETMEIEERMTICNMAVEGGARAVYVNPDETTFEYLAGREFAPKKDWDKAVEFWKSIASDSDAIYDDEYTINSNQVKPMVTWGTNLDEVISIDEKIPSLDEYSGKGKEDVKESMRYMGLTPEQKILGLPIEVVFIGSCTNGRFSDLYQAAKILEGEEVSIDTLVVPGSEEVKRLAEEAGIDQIFKDAGADWREPGCSMCLGMSPDKLVAYQRSASTSNRNFKGRQGNKKGRTHLVSPLTAAITAIEGVISDPRKVI
jgi:3-isopropylmalate/(R)-2-methylmalate dehydratase large subunit